MNPLPFILLAISLPLLLGGCGEKPVVETKPVEEKQLEVKEEVKPVEELPLNSNLKYEIKDGAVTITGCDKKASGAFAIPATIEGNPVTSIGIGAFMSCTSLTRIMIPDSVTSIDGQAFYKCTSLTSITIPDSVTSIGNGAFAYCSSLTSITFGTNSKLTSIGSSAFYKCTSLTAVTFLGDAPKAGQFVFFRTSSTIYRKPEAKGWGDTFGDRPVKLISEKP